MYPHYYHKVVFFGNSILFRPQEVQLDCASFHYYSGLSVADQDLHWANGCCFACGGHGHRAGACKGIRQPARLLCELHEDAGHWVGAVALGEKEDPWSREKIRAAGWEVGGEDDGGEAAVAWGDETEENGPWGGPPAEEWNGVGRGSPVEEWWGKVEENELGLEWLKLPDSDDDLPSLVAEDGSEDEEE
jgi:hypothetical protein